jgi:hypothetical protein
MLVIVTAVIMCVAVRVRMVVEMRVDVLVDVFVTAGVLDPRLALAATAGRAHARSPSVDLDFLHPHLVAGGDLELVAPAVRAGIAESPEGHGPAALHAPRGPVGRDDLKPRAVREAVSLHDIEREAQRVRLDVRQPADLQPHRANARRGVLPPSSTIWITLSASAISWSPHAGDTDAIRHARIER